MGFLVAGVLAHPGEALAYLPRIVQWANRSRGRSPVDWNILQHWTNKVTWNCGKCIAGFWCLIYCTFSHFTAGQGFQCVTLAIFTAYAIERWNNEAHYRP